MSLANKGIIFGCFVGRKYNKILMETGKLTNNIRVTKNGLGSGVDRMFKCVSDSDLVLTECLSVSNHLKIRLHFESPYFVHSFVNLLVKDSFERRA